MAAEWFPLEEEAWETFEKSSRKAPRKPAPQSKRT
jgi:hypothetical protein